jgi:hypothetical protein
METAIINGIKCSLPCKAISLGLNMQCHYVVTPSIILSVNEAEDKVIIESEGIKIRLRMKDLKDFYLDTKENRDRLEAQCRKEYIEWKEAVRKQLETCSRRCGI